MSTSGTLARQGTFDTAPADSIKGNSIKRGDIEIPVVFSDSEKQRSSPSKPKRKSDNDSKDSLPGRRSSNQYINVPPRDTSKPPSNSNTDSLQSNSGKTGALSSLNNKLSKGAAPIQKQQSDDKPKPALSNSLSKRQRDPPKRDSSPTKQANDISKSGKENSNRQEGVSSSSSKRSQSNQSEKGPKNSASSVVKDETSSVVPLKMDNESDSVKKITRLSRPRNRDFSPSRYEDVHVPTPRNTTSRYEDKSDRHVGSYRQSENNRSPPAKRTSDLRTNTERDEVSRSLPNPNGNVRDYGDSDRRESYEQVRLERDGLLRAEVTYKKRIRQLEDEAKSFLRDINELSDENKTLRARVDELESNESSQNREVRKENRDLLVRSEKLEKENQGLWAENQKLKSDKSDVENKVHRLTSDIESLQKNFTETDAKNNAELRDLQEKYKRLDNEHQNLRTVNFDVEKKLAEVQSENKVLSESLGEKRRELDELTKALQNDRDLQNELKQSQTELERVRKNLSNITRELDQFQNKYKDMESEKSKLEENLKEKDSEIYSMKDAVRKKKASNSELLSQTEGLKREIERLKSENAELRLLRKDISNLKEKVKSLNDELERRSEGNKKLKREKSDNKNVIEDLKRELANANATAASDADTMNDKLAKEQQTNKKLKEEMDRKSTYISKLETETFEMNMKFDSQNEKMRELEREKKEWESKRDTIEEIEDSNKKLIEENRRLRQMLVERNMDITNTQSEKTVLTSRLEKLERRQVDSDVKVKQLQGWMDGAYRDEEPIVVVTTTPLPEPGRVKPNRAKAKKPTLKRMDQKTKAASLSLEDLRQAELRLPSPRTPPSLPAIDFKLQPVGYYDIYKHKLRLMRERRF